jgi:NhaA family Na+:H+ antiporter
MNDNSKPHYIHLLQQFSIPLLLGVVVALIVANVSYPLYDKLVNHTYAFFTGEEIKPASDHAANEKHEGDHSHDQEKSPAADGDQPKESASAAHDDEAPWKHYATLHFLINDIFMVIFFGIATKEITESCLPGGALNPIAKAVNPLLGTIGGVLGPVCVYLTLNIFMGQTAWTHGWGIPTATDIALAWLVAKIVFGEGHPAISFLLLLAVADDGIGLGIIAFAYPDPNHPTEWLQALWILPGMAVAFGLRKMKVGHWLPYILIGGGLSWWGLFNAHLHPALALVPIVPFLPGPRKDIGMFEEEEGNTEITPLEHFEHDLKLLVDLGLFFFAFANAGVPFSNISNLTWIVFLSLLVGKTCGITLFSFVGSLFGFPLPTGMRLKHLFVAGIVAGLGLTVALFVAGQAFRGDLQGSAKMGALFSGGIAILAIIVGKVLGVKGTPNES